MGQTSVGRLHGRLDVLQTLLVAPPSWIQDGGAGNDINQDLGRVFRSLLRGRCKMATLPLPAAILDDLICGTGNEVIQDGRRKRKGRHFAPPPQWGSKNSPYTTDITTHGVLPSYYSLLSIWQVCGESNITNIAMSIRKYLTCMKKANAGLFSFHDITLDLINKIIFTILRCSISKWI